MLVVAVAGGPVLTIIALVIYNSICNRREKKHQEIVAYNRAIMDAKLKAEREEANNLELSLIQEVVLDMFKKVRHKYCQGEPMHPFKEFFYVEDLKNYINEEYSDNYDHLIDDNYNCIDEENYEDEKEQQ